MGRRRNRLLVGLISAGVISATILALTVSGGASQARAALAPIPKLQPSALHDVIHAIAAANGEPSPGSATAVETTRGQASQITAAGSVDPSETNRDVFLIVTTGHFTGHMAHVPPRRPLPVGTILTVVVDAHTGQLTDWGLSNNEPDLTAAGTPIGVG